MESNPSLMQIPGEANTPLPRVNNDSSVSHSGEKDSDDVSNSTSLDEYEQQLSFLVELVEWP